MFETYKYGSPQYVTQEWIAISLLALVVFGLMYVLFLKK